MDERITAYLKNQGLTVWADTKFDTRLLFETWRLWYEGYIPTWHEKRLYTGSDDYFYTVSQLNMAKTVCEKWADLLLNEKAEITIGDEYTQTVLDALLKQVNFAVRGNNLLEASFAMGGGFFVQYFDGKKVCQSYVVQDNAYPISFDSGRITEIAFAIKKIYKRKKYVYLQIHTLDDNGNYVIENKWLEDGAELKDAKDIDADIEDRIETKSATPRFQQIRPNISNKYDFICPYGMSVFNDAIDVLKHLDFVFDSYYKEFLLGKKRLFVSDGTTNIRTNAKGETVEVFDPDDEVFYKLPRDLDEGDPIKEVNGSLRISEHNLAIETLLGELSQKCGFGNDGFKWSESNVATATQIISKNSEMYRTMQKHELILREALECMAKSLLTLYKDNVEGTENEIVKESGSVDLDADISVNFDDSIIEDTAEIKRQAMLELQAGVIDLVEYYQRVYKMTEEQATEFRDKIKERNPVPEEPTLEEV